MKPLHAPGISSVYEKVIVLALIANAALFAAYVLLPRAHGKAPLDEARAEAIERIEPVAAGSRDEDLQAESRTRVIETAFGSTVEFKLCCTAGSR